jgi:uncharacterized lipoprotein YmbA
MTVRRTMAVLVSLLFAGCSFFSRTQSRFYSLDRIAQAAAPSPGASRPPLPMGEGRPQAGVRPLPIGIDVQLPPGADRKEIVVRRADRTLDVRGAEQWSASLQPLVLHTLAFDLAARLPEGMVVLPGEARPPGGMREINVSVEELVAGPDRNVVLDARWIELATGVAHHERIVTDVESLDSANVANGISRALATLADRIAAQS